MDNFEEMKREYLKQQTPEGQAVLHVKRYLLKRFREINGITFLNAGEIRPLFDKNGNIIQYYKSL